MVNSAPQYAEMLKVRDIVARDISREQFMLENASRALESARATHALHLSNLTVLRARQDTLCERQATIENARQDHIEVVTENEVDELVAIHQLLPDGLNR